jgi:NADP-dependent 3-hydroxy acid dehydrogenase YdfG
MCKPAADTGFACADYIFVTRRDVQDRDSICRAIEAGIAHFDKIDALINNSGFSLGGVFEGIVECDLT